MLANWPGFGLTIIEGRMSAKKLLDAESIMTRDFLVSNKLGITPVQQLCL